MKTTLSLIAFLFTLNSYALDVNILKLTGANAQDEERISGAVESMKRVVNSESFKSQLLAMTYKVGKSSYTGFSQTNHAPSKVLANILAANENFAGGKAGVIDLYLDMYYENSDVIGYTAEDDKFVHMNRYFHQDYTSFQTAGNLFHEWLHKINYDHSYEYNDFRPHSVPYKLGNLVARMSAQAVSKGDPILQEMYFSEFLDAFEQNCSHSSSHHE